MEVLDLLNRTVKVGDNVIVGGDTNANSPYLMKGKVAAIFEKPQSVQVVINLENDGMWAYGKDTKEIATWRKQIVYTTASRTHNNLFIIR